MKYKTKTRISIIFSIATFFIILIILIFLNVFSFFGWYNKESQEIMRNVDNEYKEILGYSNNKEKQKEKLFDELEEFWWFLGGSKISNIMIYEKLFLNVYIKQDLYYIIHKKNTDFWTLVVPYNISSYFNNQIRLLKISFILLLIFTIFSFGISKYLFIRFALKDVFYISSQLKNIDLNNIKKIDIDLNQDDEINTIINSVNNFLTIIDTNTKNLKSFNSQVAHEFKTPLMIISSELELLTLSWKDKQNYLKIENQVDILNNLIETFLFISKIENIEWKVEVKVIDVYSRISNQIENLSEVYKYKNIKSHIEITKNLELNTNIELFIILFRNILDNAFKYSKDWWTIDIILSEEYLLIKDYWVWIKKVDLNKIFSIFYRIDDEISWYWVWLSMVEKIIKILDYKIKIKSDNMKGTEFKIIF